MAERLASSPRILLQMKYARPFWCCSKAPYANRPGEKSGTHTHTSFTRATSEGVTVGREFYCIIKSAAF